MKKKISVFLISLFTLTALLFTACDKDNPDPTPQTDCSDFAVTIQVHGNEYLVAVPANGTAPYTFAWTDGSTDDSLQVDLNMAGTFAVTVTSADGCTASDTFEITIDPCENFYAGITQDGSSLVAATSGGTAPYTYSWSSGQTESTIVPNADGSYSVTITDANGCAATDEYNYVADPCANTDLSVTLQFSSNPAGNTLVAIPTGGVQPYSYSWSNDPNNTDMFTAANDPGTYILTITDANGCTASAEYTVAAGCADFKVNIVRDNSITTSIHFDAVITAGTSPFSYEWGGFGSGTESFVDIANGTSGPISVTVTDANGCIAQDNDQF